MPGDGMCRALGAGVVLMSVLGRKKLGLESLSAHALLVKWLRLSSSPPFCALEVQV